MTDIVEGQNLEIKLLFMKAYMNEMIEQVYMNKENLDVLWSKVMKDELP